LIARNSASQTVGRAAVLVKPIDIGVFLRLVRNCLELQRVRLVRMRSADEGTHAMLQLTRRTVDQALRQPPDAPGQRG
jgi:hypothetical protein